MTKDKVSVRAVHEYDTALIEKNILTGLEEIGGLASFIKPGETVILKINLLMGKDPDAAVTTHPLFVKAVIGMLQKNNNHVIIADSPGGLFNRKALEKAYLKSGITAIAEETGAELNYNTECSEIKNISGHTVNKMRICDYYTKADKVINLPKLKTHAMMTYTGAVKNLYGIIPGTDKADLHFRMSQKEVFADLLVDIHENFRPTLTIMDGIVGMEGDGPSSGTPKKIGAILLSSNAHKLDYAACEIVGMSLKEVPTLHRSYQRGLLDLSESIYTEKAKEVANALKVFDFKKPAKNLQIDFSRESSPRIIKKLITYFFETKPVILNSCIACGVCRDHCPAKVITIEKKAVIHYENCIKCYCCHELCPVSAITIKESFLVKLLKNR